MARETGSKMKAMGAVTALKMDLASVAVGILLLSVVEAAPLCLPCEAGFGVVTECNSTRSTSCAPCRPNLEFTAVRSFFDPCKPCTTCKTKSFESKACTPKSDTICMECDAEKGQHNFSENVDYRRKCLGEQLATPEINEPALSWLEYSLSHIQSRLEMFRVRNSRESGSKAPEWDGISGQGPIDVNDPFPVPYESSEVNDDLLEEEGFLPGRATATDSRPVDNQDSTSNNPGNLLDWSDIGSGSGAEPSMSEFPGGNKTEDLLGHPIADIANPKPDRGDPEPIDDTTDEPVVAPKYGAEEPLLSKQVKIGIIIASVVGGVVVCIVSFFIFFKLKKRHGKNVENGNVYIEASIDHDNRLTSELDVSGCAQSGINSDNETTPLSSTPNGTLSHNESNGVYQLPIDIVCSNVIRDPALQDKPLKFDYVPEGGRQLENNGETLKIRLQNDPSVVSGGPLGSKSYRLSECHFHWGSKDSQGSEHTINGRSYSGEVHLVHYDSQRSQESLNASGTCGLAILAVFLEVGDGHDAIELITNKLPSVQYKGETTDLSSEDLEAVSLLPENRTEYWTYTASPGETPKRGPTTWVVFREPIHISSSQLESFRQLRRHEKNEEHVDSEDSHLADNFRRPLAPPGEHAVKSSF